MAKVFFVACCILVHTTLFGQTFTGVAVDSVCTLMYDGKPWIMPPPPPPLPPHLYDSLKQVALYTNYQKMLSDIVGEVDNTKEITRFSEDVIDKYGKFNPTIIWESKKCYDLHPLKELEKILTCEQDPIFSTSPKMCFMPKHSILLYKNDEVVGHYDVCFECDSVRFNREKYIYCADIVGLWAFFIREGYPLFMD